MRFLYHTRHTTVGRTPLDEWSACRRDLYLTTHNTYNRQTSMPSVGFEPTIFFLDHTRHSTVGRIPLWTSNQSVAETSTWQHTTITSDNHPCPRWDSKPRSQQVSGRRPMPSKERPVGPAVLPINSPALITVTAADVLHSRTVPRFGVKTDATPGRLNQVSVIMPALRYIVVSGTDTNH